MVLLYPSFLCLPAGLRNAKAPGDGGAETQKESSSYHGVEGLHGARVHMLDCHTLAKTWVFSHYSSLTESQI